MDKPLKTLKDLDELHISGLIPFEELKEEAIKWIKELIDLGILGDLNSQCNHEGNLARRAQVFWIKEFFNITDKDLRIE